MVINGITIHYHRLPMVLYSSKLFDIVDRHLSNTHCYADNTQLYISFKPCNSVNQEQALAAMGKLYKGHTTMDVTR